MVNKFKNGLMKNSPIPNFELFFWKSWINHPYGKAMCLTPWKRPRCSLPEFPSQTTMAISFQFDHLDLFLTTSITAIGVKKHFPIKKTTQSDVLTNVQSVELATKKNATQKVIFIIWNYSILFLHFFNFSTCSWLPQNLQRHAQRRNQRVQQNVLYQGMLRSTPKESIYPSK